MVGISRHYCSTTAQKLNSSTNVQLWHVCPTIGNILLAAVNFKTMDLQDKDLMVFNQIKECFKSGDEISISIIQRKFALGYNASWRVMDALLSEKIVIPNENKFGVSRVA